jgi:hypothetical protein
MRYSDGMAMTYDREGSVRNGNIEASGKTDTIIYYRPFVYATPSRVQIWGRRLGLGRGWKRWLGKVMSLI